MKLRNNRWLAACAVAATASIAVAGCSSGSSGSGTASGASTATSTAGASASTTGSGNASGGTFTVTAVLPVLEQAKVPEMNTVGDPRYDSQTSADFWRLTPSDSTQAPALAYYTHQRGFTKIAEVFTSDLSASTTTTPFQNSYTKLGGTIVKAVTITPDASSYQTEVAAVLAAHPQAIVGEMDAQTAATFLSEVRQQNGSMIPVIMTQRAIQGDWEPAVGPAIGIPSLAGSVTAIAPAL